MSTVRAPSRFDERSASAVPASTPMRRRTSSRPELRVVDERRRRAGRRRLASVVVTLASVALFASLLGLAVFHAFIVQSQSKIDRLDGQISEADVRTDDLRLRLATLESPDRIMSVAVDDLGMVPAGDVVMLTPVPSEAAGSGE